MSLTQVAELVIGIIVVTYLVVKFGKVIAVLILVAALIMVGWFSLLVGFHSFSGKTLVATVRASQVSNVPDEMAVDMTTYDVNGNPSRETSYKLGGDRWMLQVQTIEVQPWILAAGGRSAYQLQRIEGQYDSTMPDSPPVGLGGWSWFTSLINNVGFLYPVVKSAYGNSLIEPADGRSYNVFADQFGDLSAKRA